MSEMTLKDAILQCVEVTGSLQIAYWLTEELIGYSSTEVVLDPGICLTTTQSAILSEAIDRIRGLEPLQYVIGKWSFRGIELACDRRALIPRPETEIVAEAAIDRVAEAAIDRTHGESLLVADLGTGSGAIALSIASEINQRYPEVDISVVATDISYDALELARENMELIARLQPKMTELISLRHGSWYEALPAEAKGRFSVIVSNPPYISRNQWNGLESTVKEHEPEIALVGGDSGIECYRHLIDGAPQWLMPNGCIVLEIDPSQAGIVADMAAVAGFQDIAVKEDLCGRPRVLIASGLGAWDRIPGC